MSRPGAGAGAGPAGADETFAAAIRASAVPMMLVETRPPGYPVAFVNEAFCRFTGYAAEEILGRDSAFLQEAWASLLPLGSRAAFSRGRAAQGEARLVRKDGSLQPVSMTLSAVRTPAGARHAFAVLSPLPAQDDRFQDDRFQDDPVAALQDTLERRTALLHELDHRTKNTLQVIASLLMLQARRSPEAAARAALDRMAERVGALAAVQRLLGGPDGGGLDLPVFAEEMAGELAAEIEPGRLVVVVQVAPVLVPAEQAVPLGLLLHELAANAVRHAFPGERPGTVRIAAVSEAGRLRLEVSDDGIGLPAGREGFGLTLVGMLVRQLGGTLRWDDAAPGTRALVSLPLGRAEG
ncbi:sensor histidine kinase [Methylobacterium sp. ID0610]|uniref:sensor histidine kinase n=1 Tax=Methylobacterium carpenticola TaxID=3344827 RepID=UPI0036865130